MVIKIPILKPEEMSYEETSETLEQIKQEEKRRKKVEKEYIFTKEDIKEMNRRLAEGEDIEEVTLSISEKGIASQQTPKIPKVRPMPPLVKPEEAISPIEIVKPTEIEPTELIPLYLRERQIKKAKQEEKKILRSEEKRIDYPVGECCSNLCDVINKEIEQYVGMTSPDKDTKLKFDVLKELRRQFYLQDVCQCANGHFAERYDIPLREEQTEDCCPKACKIINNEIDEHETVMFPTHKIRIEAETFYDIRAKMYKNNACKCVENEEQLKKRTRGGPAMDPLLQNRLTQLLKYAEKQGWVK